ncbi:hypothetical protein KBC99_00560 [Candidatus Saccharibacteria bacterium]|nr:hypothetical protein [Candidatus Saccharibacteria bacterium]
MQDAFDSYQPKILNFGLPRELSDAVYRENLLVCGELHGVRENADVAFTLFQYLGPATLFLERDESEVGQFLESLKKGEPEFSFIDPDVFRASVLSLEMAKIIMILIQSGKISRIVCVDGDNEATFERDVARNVMYHMRNEPAIAILGNWHTEPEIIATDEGQHKSALQYIRETMPKTPLIQYKYLGGSFYNAGSGLQNIASRGETNTYNIIRENEVNWGLFIPHATPAWHE